MIGFVKVIRAFLLYLVPALIFGLFVSSGFILTYTNSFVYESGFYNIENGIIIFIISEILCIMAAMYVIKLYLKKIRKYIQ